MTNQPLRPFLDLCLNPYLLLILSIISIAASIINTHLITEIVVIGLLNIIMLLIALRNIRNGHFVFSKKIFISLVTLVLISLSWDVVFYLSPQAYTLKSVFFMGAVLIRLSIFAYGWWTLAKILAIRQKVTDRTIVTAIVGYLFIGIIYSFAYFAIWQIDPNAIHISVAREYELRPWNLVMYFSFMTLTTVGYGDIIPINKWIMMLSNFEAMTGSVYLTVIIARLVSLYSTSE